MAKKTIPDEVKQQVTQIVERFNRKKHARSGAYFVAVHGGNRNHDVIPSEVEGSGDSW